MSFDLSTLDSKSAAEAGTFVHLDSPATGEPMYDDDGVTPFGIGIIGGDSGKVSDELRAIADRRLERIQRNRSIVTNSLVGRQEDINTMAAATTHWHLPPVDGEVLVCSEVSARKLYADPRFPWIMEQLEKAIGDRKRFFKRSSKNSSATLPGTPSSTNP
jgi:hypothetical protein